MKSNTLETYKVPEVAWNPHAANKIGVEIKPMISAPILLSEAAVVTSVPLPLALPLKHLTRVARGLSGATLLPYKVAPTKAPSNAQLDLPAVVLATPNGQANLAALAQIPPPSMVDEMNEIMDRLRSSSYATCDIGQCLGIRTASATANLTVAGEPILAD